MADRLLALLGTSWAALVLAGCGLGTAGSRPEQDIPEIQSEGEVVIEHLSFLGAFSTARPEEQAGILESARESAAASPSPENRLRYALLLALPGGPDQDPGAAVDQLVRLLDDPDALQPSERLLARLVLADASARASLLRETEQISSQAARNQQEREQVFNRRIQAQATELDRLRQALEEAESKLKAVAELEKSLTERPSTPKAPPP